MEPFVWRSLWIAVLVIQFSGCAVDGRFGPQRQSPAPGAIQTPSAAPSPEYPGPATRSFYMGFTLWPADLTPEGAALAKDFAHARGDIVAVNFIGGIPWPEALDGRPFSKDVQENMAYRPPSGKKLFLSISPLNRDKRGLAPYWGETDNRPLPGGWEREALNGPRVKKAFLNFVLRSINAMKPDYLAIGVESNVLLSRDPARWRQLKELHRDTYIAVKRIHKALPVFFTTEVLHYRRLSREAKSGDQEKEVAEMMRHSDLFAMSLYPYMSAAVPRPVPANFFDFARRFNKPIAVAESGMISRTVELKSYGAVLPGSDADQQLFTELLLKTAERDGYEFVINFAAIDSDRLVARLRPPLDDRARIWAYIGMQTSDRRPKPALSVWDGFFRAKYEKVKWW